jgi:hypothetical protein
MNIKGKIMSHYPIKSAEDKLYNISICSINSQASLLIRKETLRCAIKSNVKCSPIPFPLSIIQYKIVSLKTVVPA